MCTTTQKSSIIKEGDIFMVFTPRRKVFISYYHGDQDAVNKFVRDFSDVFIPKTVGVKDGDFDFDSNDPQYIMRKIRETKLSDSTVTIVLIGSCTHSRRYVDWEVKASLQQGTSLPNGLIAINLPYMGKYGALPSRVEDNVSRDSQGKDCGYARYYAYPNSKQILHEWIEDAHSARISRSNLIKNTNIMMKYNSKCTQHGVTH